MSATTSENMPGKDGPPTTEMSREEVKRQREEKKKLKAARKGKAGPGSEGGSVGEDNQPKQKPSEKQPQQTPAKPPKQQKPKNAEDQASAVVAKETKKPEQKQSEVVKAKNSQQQREGKDTSKNNKQVEIKQSSKESSPLPSTLTTKPSVTPGESEKPTEPKEATKEDPALTSDKSTIKFLEYQSTIQCLFRSKKSGENLRSINYKLHPLFHNVGVRLKNNVVRGTNQRCVTLLHTVKDYVRFFETPSGKTFKHSLSTELRSNLEKLRRVCPFSIGMSNSVEFINSYIHKLEDNNEIAQKEDILEMIDQYIVEKIEKAVEAIELYGSEKVRSGDVIMIYSITEALLSVLVKAADDGSTFNIIVIHTPETMFDIPVLLDKLREPISSNKVMISSVNFSNAIHRMRHCSKLIIGGHGLFTTGGVMAQTGSGQLALLAATHNKPAVFLCETYKFCDRSPLDYFTLDEFVLDQSRSEEDLFEPNIKYDVTPANLVTVVITDIDVLPSTSVPVVLRVQEGRSAKKLEECFEMLQP